MNNEHDTDEAVRVGHQVSDGVQTVACRDCNPLSNSIIEQLGKCNNVLQNATRLLMYFTNQLIENFTHTSDPSLVCERGGQCLADVVEILIDSGADVNVTAADGKTPLMLVSSMGYTSIAKLLIERGAASLEQIDEAGETALTKAVSNGRDEVAHLLLHFSADENAMVPRKEFGCGATVLHVAAGRGLSRCVDHLLRKCVDRHSCCNRWNSRPLKSVAGDKQKNVIASSMARLDVNCKDHIGNTPLHWACREGGDGAPVGIIGALIERGAVINDRNCYGRTPLHFAVINNNEPLVMSLIRTYGADVNAKDICGNTVLHMRLAANRVLTSRKSDLLIGKLLDCGAELNAANDEGMTPLHVACNRKYRARSAIDILIGRGASINEADIRGMTPLHHMFVKDAGDAGTDLSPVVSIFTNVIYRHRADVTTRTRYSQRTPLHLAISLKMSVEQQNPFSFPELLKSAFIVDALQNTPCHYDILTFSCFLCNEEHCDPSKHAKNKCGRTPYLNDTRNFGRRFLSCIAADEDSMGRSILHMYCSLVRYDKPLPSALYEISSFLTRCRELGLFSKTDRKGRSGLHHLCIAGMFKFTYSVGETDLFKLFSNCLNDRDCLGRTALFYATLYQHCHIILRLMDAGADPGIPDDEEIFPENIAAARGMTDGVVVSLAAARQNRSSSSRECIYSRRGKYGINSGLVLATADEYSNDSLLERSQMEFDDFVRFVNHGFDEVLTDSVQKHVTSFVVNVMRKVAELDSRFSSVVYLVGSSHSRTRIKYPGDFDFSIILTSFEEQVTAQENDDYPHCVTFRRNTVTQTPDNTSEYEKFLMSDGTLDTQHVKHQLYLLIIEATSLPDVWQDNVFEYLKLVARSEATSPAIKLTLTPNRMWINRTGKNGKIEKKLYLRSLSVDIVPCLRTGEPLMTDSPLGSYTADYATDLKECIAIFKQPKFAFGPQMTGLCPASFVRVEAEVIRRSPAAVRAAYMWLKIQEKLEGVHSYMLQMCILHCIVSKKFDQISFSEKVCKRSLKECLGIITTELLDIIKQDEICSVGIPRQRLPVWKFEPFAKFSIVYLDCLMGFRYPASELVFNDTFYPSFDLRPTDMWNQGKREEGQLESNTAKEIQRCFKDVVELCGHFVSIKWDSSLKLNDACSDQVVTRRIALYDECQRRFGSFMTNSRDLDRMDPVYHACFGFQESFSGLCSIMRSSNYDDVGRSIVDM